MDENNLVGQMPPTIGRYKVLEGIGFGAMGAVYKAFDPKIKRTLAIKTIRLDIPRQSPQYRSFIERFQHEARISGTLSHPNIVTLFDIGEEGGVPFLAMEFVEGETIASILERGTRFKPERVVSLVSQIAAALDYAHVKGVIHRDVKPANLMLFEGDRIKVTDFGIAKLMDAEMTQSGTLLGTPSYMSPEQAMGDRLDGRSDIFSLGVCAFEMLSGEQPFPGNNVTSILYKLVHVDPVEPVNLELNGLVPTKWHEVFGKVLAKRPDDRYQTAGAFVRDLEYCLGSWFGGIDGDRTIAMAGALDPGRADTIRRPVMAGAPRPGVTSAAPPPAAEEDSPATIVLGAPSEEDTRTVMLQTPPMPPPPPDESPATVLLKAPAPPGPPPPEEEDSATVVLAGLPEPEEDPVTVVLPRGPRKKSPEDTRPLPRLGALAEPASLAPGPARPTEKMPVTIVGSAPTEAMDIPPATGAMPVPVAPARRPGLSSAALLGGAAALFAVAAAVVGFLFLRDRGEAPPAPTPAPTAEAAVTPPAEPSTPAPPSGLIRIETTPAGAAVTVNGEVKGASPLELTGLGLGPYEVKLELKGYDGRTESVELTEEAPQGEIKVALTRPAPTDGIADILSTPFGAAVSIDGASLGVTPLTDQRLKPGTRKLELTKDGYEPWSGTIKVQAGRRARVDAELKQVVKATPPPEERREVVDTRRVYLPSQVDTPPKKVSGVTASYPEGKAPKLKSGQSISVVVSWVVDENGEVTDIAVVESASRVVDEAVTSAISAWRYQPGVKKGVKVKVKLTLKQTFQSG